MMFFRTMIVSMWLLLAPAFVFSQVTEWKPVPGKIATPWTDKVDPAGPLAEYPRPQMVRPVWMNLNGLWSYAIAPVSDPRPKSFEGKILVPFAIESSLSGVGKIVGQENNLWYTRSFNLPADFKNKRTLLHFGAVDWRCEVFINDTKAGTHEGGYDPFYFDITDALKKSGAQTVTVKVWDPTDDGPQPRGKQVKKPNSIWYTSVTGIWQTVWLEAVPQTFIAATRHVVNFDAKTVTVKADVSRGLPGDKLRLTAWDGSQRVAELESESPQATLAIANAKAWTPATPHLYDLSIAVVRKGKVVDEVKSYFGMRKVSMAPDGNRTQRMLLNDQFVFQYGPLDQGWWPDGLYTAPTDEALKFDIEKTKAMGFNMIRKHVKVEPARWYYHCDRMGVLVWQDMPSGDLGNRWDSRPGIVGVARDQQRTGNSEAYYIKEWKSIIDACFNFPSIVAWVPFNEAWGQFKTEEIVKLTQQHDSTRLINAASGGNFSEAGHMLDLHNYPEPAMPDPTLFGKKQAIVLGEYGGLGLPLEGHTWQEKDNWGYRSFKTADELLQRYAAYIGDLTPLVKQGLSAAVYTQTTDVEIEVNGLMTYDRRVVKVPEAVLRDLHAKLYEAAKAVQTYPSPAQEGWISLFDGKTFNGWKASENPSTFSIADGMIVVNGDRAHLFYVGNVNNHNFKNFEFKATVMTTPGSNSGMYFHTQYQEEGWPSKGYEVQVNATHTDWRKTSSIYGIQDVKNAPNKDHEWFTQHIIVRGRKITVKVNDKVVNEYTAGDDNRLQGGTFALQGHDPQSKVFYKDVMVRILPD